MSDLENNTYLVLGATGSQGGAMLRALVDHGARVRGFARRPAEDSSAPIVTGDLGDAEAVRRAFDGITHAAVTLPLVYDVGQVAGYAENIAAAARAAGVRQLVFNTNTCVPAATTEHAAFETRRTAEEILRTSGVPVVVLRPPVYLENFCNPGSAGPLFEHGVLAYPLPEDRRVAWLTHADLAAAVVAALHRTDLVGTTLEIGGAEVVTGPELAALFAQALGRDVRYLALDVDAFESGLSQAIGAQAAAGVSGIYRYANSPAGRNLFDIDGAVLSETFDVEPMAISGWVAAQPWARWSPVSTANPG